MSLQVWMPLLGNLDNQGLCNITPSGTPTFLNDGKIGKSISLNPRTTFTGLPQMYVFTICFWLKVDSCTVDWADSLSFNTYRTGSANGTFRFEATKTRSACSFHDNSAYNICVATNNNVLISSSEYGQWHHCTFVCDGTTCTAYKDGVLTSTNTAAGGYIYNYFHIGETNNIVGAMNDLRIYDEALSPARIKDISRGLFIHYKLSNLYDTVIADCSGYRNNAESVNVVLNNNTARYDKSAYFNPTDNSYAVLPASAFNFLTGSFTISFWLNVSTWNTNERYSTPFVICSHRTNCSWKYCIIEMVYIKSRRYTVISIADGTNYDNSLTISGLTLNTWYHFCITYETGTLSLYLDGSPYKSISTTVVPAFSSAVASQLGLNIGSIYAADAYMSDFRMYSTALSAADIKELYQTAAKIDNKQNMIAYEFVEDSSFTNANINKNGSARSNDLEETTKVSLYDNGKLESNTFIES